MTSACSDDNDVSVPQIQVEVDNTQLDLYQSMTIRITGDYQQAVVWTGDKGHNYDLRDEIVIDENGLRTDDCDYGLVVNKGLFTYSYSTPGTYKVVCLASNYNEEGKTIKTETYSFNVEVYDDHNKIEKISAVRSPYYEIYAEELTDTDWVLGLPRKISYNNKDLTVNAKRHYLNIELESQAATVEINDEAWTSNTYYDLNSPLTLVTTSSSNVSRTYTLWTVIYPEFSAYAIGDVKATFTRSPFDYAAIQVDIQLPAGTDLAHVKPVFTLTDPATESAYIDGVLQVSGETEVDLTQPVTYTLVAHHAENPNAKTSTTFVVNAVAL